MAESYAASRIDPTKQVISCSANFLHKEAVHDYRAMNERTIRQSTPMPRKDVILDKMSGALWYSCFDL
ncbi:hypothetical protein PHMEG_00021602 [Phytophthora megakarya]|uniref:Uncharacterized protein n=1 Tax=Phytophthora megakarya TaxID=4795 RepID=A0A225VNR9_9STRA|nr:hypothetical protein PHMEG_00021602 [Phytophthora megakarya]